MKRVAAFLALGVSVAAAQQPGASPPAWAYGFATPLDPNAPPPAQGRGGGPGRGPVQQSAPDTATRTLQGSTAAFTLAQIRDGFGPADWFPGDHPAMPDVVAHGRRDAMITACSLCHYPNGKGRPENASVAGLPYEYFLKTMSDFKNDARKSADTRKTNTGRMVQFAKTMTDDEIKAATRGQCALCHGPTLQGLGPVPGIAGRSPSYMVRQMFDMQHGTRTGSWSELMKRVVGPMTSDDMLNVAAYVASLPSPSTADTTCLPIRNVDSVLVRGRITLFGEIHGTDKLPDFVANVVCQAWKRRMPVTLGVELASESSHNLDAFVHSPGDSASARATLLADSVWHGSWLDGRSSLAMARLFERARALSRAGANIRVVAFSRPSTPNRDSTMAAELARALASDTSRAVIILTGNIHSRVTVGVASDSTLRPMALRLRELIKPRRVIGLNANYQAGTAWICSSDGCGAHALKAHETIAPGGIELGPIDKAYDGVYSVGPIVASPPAVGDAQLRGKSHAMSALLP